MLPDPDVLWEALPTDGLPTDLVDAFERKDWPRLRELVGTASQGVYGRQAVQFRARLPLGVDPVLSQLRGWAAFLSGDWDDLERCLAVDLVDRAELAGLRDVLLTPVTSLSGASPPDDAKIIVASWTYRVTGAAGKHRRLARKMLGWRSDPSAVQRGVSAARHARYRRLQDRFMLAATEAAGGQLDVAATLALEAEELGEEGDNMRILSADLYGGVEAARGGPTHWTFAYPDHVSGRNGPTPMDAVVVMLRLSPFLALREDGALDWAARFAETAAIRLGSPGLLLQAESWRAASRRSTAPRHDSGTAALLLKAREAGPGLRCLPLLLDGIATRRTESFVESEHTARRAGAVWVQVSALAWLVALNPDATVARDLARLLVVSGWRRPAMVPSEIAGDAALGLTSAGIRDAAVVELALAAGRANVTYEVARRHLEDPRADKPSQQAAVAALAAIGTTHARELLHLLARRPDPIGHAASEHLARSHPTTLSEREVEVLDLAGRGMTNKEIAERLSLSPHTVARHLANARAKLGAANRAEAVAKLGARS